jgi:hypothetical protein
MSMPESRPTVSIIVPTYNRAAFLPLSLESIRAQTWTDWELIVVDDGGRDHSAAVVEEFAAGVQQPVRYVWRENGGPGVARNTGLDLAQGKYVAFLDSDDSWLPHHLNDGVAALKTNPQVGWIFAAGQRIEYRTKRVLIEHTMYGTPEPPRYLKLRTRRVGNLRVFDDPRLLACALRNGGLAGLQTSLVRREVFANLRFHAAVMFEDRIAFIRAVAMGVGFGYFDDVHAIVYSHGDNVSFASEKALDARIASLQTYITALEVLQRDLTLSRAELRALQATRGEEAFWHMGYALADGGRHRDALVWMRYGLRCCPTNIWYWKTYAATSLKAMLAGNAISQPQGTVSE